MLLRLFCIAALMLVASRVFSDAVWMSNGELRTAFAGQTIAGYYSDGRTFVETYKQHGGIDYKEGGRRLVGHWSVVSGTFCTIYDGLTPGGCFRVQSLAGNCYEFYSVTLDEAAAADPKKHKVPVWTARAWQTNRQSTCPEQGLV